MKRVLAATAILGTLLAGCNAPGSKQDAGNAYRQRLAKLHDQYGCHIGAALRTDAGALVKPRGSDRADKLGHVTAAAAAVLGTNFDLVQWCAK